MESTLKLNNYGSVKTRKIEWLWKPYIALGKITILQGDPGDGKSTLALLLASIISNGINDYKIDGLNVKGASKVIYQAAEDSPEDTIKPKLVKFNANTNNILFVENDDLINLRDSSIEDLIYQSQCKLLIFDPIQSFFKDGDSMYGMKNAREIMNNLIKIAKKTNCAFLLIGHLNKASNTKDLYRGLGSIDFTAVARSILYLKRSEVDSKLRIMYQIKNSIAEEGSPVAFKLQTTGLKWLGKFEEEPLIDDMLPKDKISEAKELIMNCLQNEDMILVSTIKELANDKNISLRTLNKAKKELEIASVRSNDKWYWKL